MSTSTAPLALQLYTLREQLAQDFAGTLGQVARIGYVGVETAGLHGLNARAVKRLCADLGLAITSAHAPLPLGDQQVGVLEMMSDLGCTVLVSGGIGAERYRTLPDIERTCARFNEAHAVAARHGLRFGIHNHWWEFEPVEAQYPFKMLLARLHPDIFFELDTYWIQTAGLDPAAIIREFGARAPLLHIKDGPATKTEPMVAVGDGALDVPAVVRASRAEWLIVELDRCTGDMLQAVERSYRYLTREGLAHGRQG